MRHLQYKDYDRNYRRCRHVLLNDRAYASIISEVLKNGKNETGGVLVGNIVNGIWYVIDSLDPGLETTNQQTYFQWDADYVNHLVETISLIYRYPVTILGFWHRHPGSMDFFSATDEDTIRSNLRESRFGLLSMLVNIDPELRMSFYYCWEESLHRVHYDVGDEYFPVELLEYAAPSRIAENIGSSEAKRVKILPNKVYSADQFPKTLSQRKAIEAVDHHIPLNASVQCGTLSASVDQIGKTGTSDLEMENLRSTLLQQREIIGELSRQKAEWEKERQKLKKEKEDWEKEKQILKKDSATKQESERMPGKDVEEQKAVVATAVADERDSTVISAESEGINENVFSENISVDDISTKHVDEQPEQFSKMMNDMSGETVSTKEEKTEAKESKAGRAGDSSHKEDILDKAGVVERETEQEGTKEDGTKQASGEGDS